ncbi:MAG: lipopolysaccharide biosynthesis protein [Alteraurantiacibacter sp.]
MTSAPPSEPTRKRTTADFGPLSGDIGSQTMHGSIAALSAQGIRMGLQLATTMVLARLLTPEDFGLIAIVAVVLGFSNLFADFGLSAATVQRKELDHNTLSVLFYIQLGIGLVLTAGIMLAAPLFADFFDDDRITLLVIAMAPTLLFQAAAAQHIALLQRRMMWLKMQGVPIIAMACGSVAAIALTLTTDIGYWALVVQIWIAAVMTCAMAWAFSLWRPGRVSDWSAAAPVVKFGLNLTGYNILNGWHRQFDNIIIGAVVGPQQLGYYSRAYGLLMLPLTAVVRPFNSAVYPAMSRLQAEPDRWSRMFLSSVATITCITAPLAGLLVLLADVIIPLLFGDQWLPSIDIFQVLSISMMVHPVYTAAGLLSFTLGRSRHMLYASIVSTAIYTVAFVIGIEWGAIGVAASYTVAVFLIVPPWVWWSARGTSVRAMRVFGAVAPPIFAATVALLIAGLSPLNQQGIGSAMVEGLVFCVIYAGLLLACWLFFKEWRKDVDPAKTRVLAMIDGAFARFGGRRG